MVIQRNWLDESPDERAEVFNEISEYVTMCQGSPHQALQAAVVARVLTAVVEVFARQYRSSDGLDHSPGEFNSDDEAAGVVFRFCIMLSIMIVFLLSQITSKRCT